MWSARNYSVICVCWQGLTLVRLSHNDVVIHSLTQTVSHLNGVFEQYGEVTLTLSLPKCGQVGV